MIKGEQDVLIVDDDMFVRDALRLLLKRKGLRVDEACSGIEAFKKISSNKPDIILLNGEMSGMDGYELYWKLKEDLNTRDIFIIFCASLPVSEITVKGIKADVYMEKPFSFEELFWALRRFIP